MDSLTQLRRQAALDELLGQRIVTGPLTEDVGENWLRHVEWLQEVDSTNSLAKRWYAQNANAQNPNAQNASETPALFVADQQTAGRGRGSNQWWSPSGCLMLTLVIPINEMPNDPKLFPQLALVTGVALAETADALLSDSQVLETQLKWPNDAYLDGRKLAGILIEALQTRSQTTGFAIGIGINTQINWSDAPEHIREKAVCLSSFAGRAIECETVLIELVQQIRKQLANWREWPDEWLSSWRARCLLTGRVVKLRAGENGEVVGRCEGIDDEGRLLIRSENQLHRFTSCEILNWG